MTFSTMKATVGGSATTKSRRTVGAVVAVVTSIATVGFVAAPAGASPAAATVSISPSSHSEFAVGSSQTFTVSVTAPASKTPLSTGTVSFSISGAGGQTCDPVDLSSGPATCAVTVPASVSNFSVTANYGGSAQGGPASTTGYYGTWNQPVNLGPAVTSFASVSCTDDGLCEAVGSGSTSANGSVSGSQDGGATWSLQQIPKGVGPLAVVTCISSGVCLTGGSDGSHNHGRLMWTGDGGATWHLINAGSSLLPIRGMTCAAGTCVLVGGDANETTPFVNQATYTVTTDANSNIVVKFTLGAAGTLPQNVSQLTAIACPSASKCDAVGSTVTNGGSTIRGIVVGSNNGGATWSTGSLPSGTGKLQAIACPNTSRCYVVGGAILASTNGGASYVVQSVNGPVGRFGGVQCQSATTCIASGNRTVTLAGALPWRIRPQPASLAYGAQVTCHTNGPCVQVGISRALTAATATSANGGANWAATAYEPNSSILNAVACPSTTTCVAVGDGAMRTTNGGASYSALSIPVQISILYGITCPTVTTCIAVGGALGQGQITTTTSTGSSWTLRDVPSDVASLSEVSCSSLTFCMAVGAAVGGGGAVLVSSDGGASWSEQAAPTVNSLTGVSCPTATTCLVVGSVPGSTSGSSNGVAFSTTDGGATFNQDAGGPATVAFTSVTCTNVNQCLIGGSNGTHMSMVLISSPSLFTLQGATVALSPQYGINAVACASATACAAVGASRPYNEGLALSGTPSDLVSATGGHGVSTAFDGSVVSLNGVSCSSNNVCTAVGRNLVGTAVIVQVAGGTNV